MKHLIFSLSVISIFFTSCSGGSDPVEDINTIESQIVGKTFWRLVEGPHYMDFSDCIPHYSGLEFNQDGNVYFRYCADSILLQMSDGSDVWDPTPNYTPITWFDNPPFFINKYLGIDYQLFGQYSLMDDKIRVTYYDDQVMSREEFANANNIGVVGYSYVLNNFSDQNNYQDLEIDSISENHLRLNLILGNSITTESQASSRIL